MTTLSHQLEAGQTPDERDALRRELLRRQAEQAVRNFAAFTMFVWPEIEPGRELTWNWHIGLLCRELQRVLDGGYFGVAGTVNGHAAPKKVKPDDVFYDWPTPCRPDHPMAAWVPIRELVLCIPPGFLKSILVSVLLPAFAWLSRPERRALYVANDDDLAKRDSQRSRELIESDRYALCKQAASRLMGVPRWELAADQNEKHHFRTSRRGFRQAFSYGAKVTGKRGDMVVVDDPMDAKEAVLGSITQIVKRMQDAMRVYDFVLASRLNNQNEDPRILIQQRLHPQDPAGQLIARGVRHVVLPNEYEPDHPHRHPEDPRTKEGELLCEEILNRKSTESLKAHPESALHYGAQYQQRPRDREGGFFRREDLHSFTFEGPLIYAYRPDGKRRVIPKADCWCFLTADTALSDSDYADFTAIGVWYAERSVGENGEPRPFDLFLADVIHERLDGPRVESTLRQVMNAHPAVFTCLESWSGSKMIIHRLIRMGLNIHPYKPGTRSKVTRSFTAQIAVRHGRHHMLRGAPWRPAVENELVDFPTALNDDLADMVCMAHELAEDTDLWRGLPEPEPAPNTMEDVLGLHRRTRERILRDDD